MAAMSHRSIVRIYGAALPAALRLFVLCVAAVSVGWFANRLRNEPIRLTGYETPTQCSEASASPSSSVMTAQEVSALCGRDDVLFADARDEKQFEEGHVTGAIHLSCTASRGDVGQLMTQLSGKHQLVVYGQSTAEARQVADGLLRQTKRRDLDVIVLDGGFAAWRDTGLACSSGACDHCSESSSHARP